MSKKIMKITVVILWMFSFLVGNVSAEELIKMPIDFSDTMIEEITLKADNKIYHVGKEIKELNVAPYIKDDTFMLPLDFFLDMMGMDKNNMTWDKDTNIVLLFKEDKIIQMTPKKNQWMMDGNKIDTNVQIEIKDNMIMIPLSIATKIWDMKYMYNRITKTLTFNIKKQKIEETKKYDYTYEDLLERVYKYSRDLKRLDLNVDIAQINKDEAKNNIKSIPTGMGNGADDAARTSAYIGLEQNRIDLKNAENRIKTKKDQLAYDLKKSYDDVLKNEDNMKIKKLELEIENENFKQINIKYEYGSISENEKIQAKRDYEQMKKGYEMNLEDLNKVYENLNDLVGFNKEERYILKDEIKFNKIDDDDVEYHIARMISISPEIWEEEKNVKIKDLGVKLHTFNAGGSSYDIKKMNLKQANMNLGDKKKAYGENLRNTYKILKRYKDKYKNILLSYEKTKDDLKKAKIDLEIGSTTPIEVKRKNLALEREKKNLKDKVMDYNELLMKYNKPWIN